MENFSVKKEDYEEPGCPFCMPDTVTPVPIRRILEKLDEYLSKKDYTGAERHLKYWLAEGKENNDKRGLLTVMNELIGLYRKTEKEEKAMYFSEKAIITAEEAGLCDTVTMGTTLINAATAYKAFGYAERALPLYEKARTLYEKLLDKNDERLGALYNNMGLTLCELKKYRQAEELYTMAIELMSSAEAKEAETAITYCNLADLVFSEEGKNGKEKITAYLKKAIELLDKDCLSESSDYAYICEKCAPTFGFYGYMIYENELYERAKRIYEGT